MHYLTLLYASLATVPRWLFKAAAADAIAESRPSRPLLRLALLPHLQLQLWSRRCSLAMIST